MPPSGGFWGHRPMARTSAFGAGDEGSSPSAPSTAPRHETTICVSSEFGIKRGMWVKIDYDWSPTFKFLGHEFKFQWPVQFKPFRFAPYLLIRRISKYRGLFQVASVIDSTTVTLSE